jgi:hypothetical protein
MEPWVVYRRGVARCSDQMSTDDHVRQADDQMIRPQADAGADERDRRTLTDPDEDRLARHLVAGKYQPTYSGDLSTWRDTALPVAINLAPARESDT